MKYLCYIIFFCSLSIQAQKYIEKQWHSERVNTVDIQGDQVFNISIKTQPASVISVKAIVEGEHSEDIVLVSEIKNSTLFLSTNFQPLFKEDNDKLSAHKVISIELIINVPEGFKINLMSKLASAKIEGQYHNVFLDLYNGTCVLLNFNGNATVNTLIGNISVETNYATITAHTKHGNYTKDIIDPGNHVIRLNSVNGNINITKSKK